MVLLPISLARSLQLMLAATLLVGCAGSDHVGATTGHRYLPTQPAGAPQSPQTPGENGAPEIATGFAAKTQNTSTKRASPSAATRGIISAQIRST